MNSALEFFSLYANLIRVRALQLEGASETHPAESHGASAALLRDPGPGAGDPGRPQRRVRRELSTESGLR